MLPRPVAASPRRSKRGVASIVAHQAQERRVIVDGEHAHDGIARLGVLRVLERGAHSMLYPGTPVLAHGDEEATRARRFTWCQPCRSAEGSL